MRPTHRIGGIERGVKDRPGDCCVSRSELLEKIFNLLRRELRKTDDDLSFDEIEALLEPFDISPEQLPERTPRATIADCGRTELEDKLKPDPVTKR